MTKVYDSAIQSLTKLDFAIEKQKQKAILAPWIDPNSIGHQRARMAGGESAFSIKHVAITKYP